MKLYNWNVNNARDQSSIQNCSRSFSINKHFLLLLALAASSLSDYSTASGYARPGPGGLPQQAKDPSYERGKALLKGRIKNYRGVQVCLLDTETGKLHKPSKNKLQPYRKVKAVKLALQLFNCKQAETLIAKIYKGNDLAYLVYYLDRRYKLQMDFNQS